MSIKASDLKKSSIININGAPHMVEQIQVQTPSARGGSSLYKVRYRNAQTKAKVDQTYRGDDTLEEIDFFKKEVQYLYKNGDDYTFMDVETYDQFDLKANEIEDSVPYLVDDMEGITALLSDDRVLGIRVPDVIEMEIAECEPSIKGASATSRTKPATLISGLVVNVPEYISQGDVIKVDTRTNSFLSRA